MGRDGCLIVRSRAAIGIIGRNGYVQNAKCRGIKTDDVQPKDAKPHHLVFVADPQIIDPHSYPGRPWPINPLTVLITDNYLRRGYRAMQRLLHPDSLFFLGDLFDGGREWKTREGKFVDPKWGRGRSKDEKKLVESWHNKYGEDFW